MNIYITPEFITVSIVPEFVDHVICEISSLWRVWAIEVQPRVNTAQYDITLHPLIVITCEH